MDYKSSDKQYIMNTYARNSVVLVKGYGAEAQDDAGKTYIDLGSGIGVNSLGYCDKEWADAVSAQANCLQHTSNLYYSMPDVQLAEKLCNLTGYSKVCFSNSGAEANECAFKLARKYSFDKYGKGRDVIVSLVNSFHGRTMATLTATGQDVFHNYFFPFLGAHEYMLPSAEELQRIDTKKTCAVVLELVQGEGGVVALSHEFVQSVYKFCTANDILLIVDEVQTGIGRTGKLLTSQLYDFMPDITTLAKGLGGGLPIGACLCGEKCKDTFTFGNHGTTFGGNPVVCAGANVVLDKVAKQEFLDEVVQKSEYIRRKLSEIQEVESLSGLGLMIGVQLKTKSASDVLAKCLQQGVMLLTAKTKIRLLPPLTITYQQIDKALAIIKSVMEA